MTNKFTVVNSNQNLDTVAPIGTRVLVYHDTSNTYDKKALRVKLEHNGELLGFIGQNVIAEGTLVNKFLYDIMESSGKLEDYVCVVVEHEVLKMGNNNNLSRTSLVIEPLEKVTGNAGEEESPSAVKFELHVKGQSRKYKGKVAVLNELLEGQTPVIGLKMVDDQIIAFHGDVPAGEVAPSSKDYDLAVQVITTVGEVTANAINPNNATFSAKFTVDEETMIFVKTGKKVPTLQGVKDEKAKFIPVETLEAVHQYLDKAGMTSKQIMKVMETYKEYPADVRGRIPSPKTLFEDSFGGVKRTVTYLVKNKHLRMIGEKGTGKNVMTATLAWVFQRPLYELSMNSQTDKMDLLGSKTFETEIENGKEITKIAFQKEALVEAMEVGGFVNLDEINAADPSILIMLHSIADDRRSVEVAGYKRVVAEDNFALLLTMNKDYIGTTTLNEAFRDRFTPILFPNNESIAQMLKTRVKGAKASEISTCDKIYKSMLTLVRDGSMSMDVLTTRGFIVALEVSEDIGLKDALIDNVANAVEDEDYRITVLGFIEDNLG